MTIINDYCRKMGMKSIFTTVRGVCGLLTVDYGSTYVDRNKGIHKTLTDLLSSPKFASLNECAAGWDDKCRSRALLSAFLVTEEQPDAIGDEWIDRVMSRYQELTTRHRDSSTMSWESFPLDKDEMVRLRHSLRLESVQCPATAAVMGGVAAQETIRAITHESSSDSSAAEQRLMLFEALSVLPLPSDSSISARQLPEDCMKDLSYLYGSETTRKLQSLRVLVAGVGAIGCELLKNFALLNVSGVHKVSSESDEDRRQGHVIVVDPDSIEPSNLNRQLLFRLDVQLLSLYKYVSDRLASTGKKI